MILPSRLDPTEYGRENIRNLSVALVGVGAIGSEIARLLGALGVNHITLIDSDVIEPINQTQGIFFRRPKDRGYHKTEVVAEQAREYFPNVHWASIPQEIADVGFQELDTCSILFSATDNTLARIETAYVCRRLGIPMIDTGLLGSAYWCGRTAWFAPETDAACYLCLLGEAKRAELLAFSHSAKRSCAEIKENLDMPSTPTMSSIIAGMAIDLALRLCLPKKQQVSLAWDVSLDISPTIACTTLKRSATCPFHTLPDPKALVKLDHDMPFRSSLHSLGVSAIELDWPIVTEMRCEHCGKRLHPMRRLAWVRRHGRCSQCDSGQLSPQKVVSRIAKDSPFGEYTPQDLSFSRKHLYTAIPKHE